MVQDWSRQKERGTRLGVLAAAWIYKLAGRRLALIVLAPVVLFFFLKDAGPRRSSREYLARAHAYGLLEKRPTLLTSYRHFMMFTGALLDKFAAWSGHIPPSRIEGVDDGLFDAAKQSGRGAIIFTAHVGNPELIRAVATVNKRFNITVLVHTAHAEQFNSVIKQFASQSTIRLVQVTQIDLATAMQLSSAIDRGEWVVIAADRTPANLTDPAMTAPATLFGHQARFPVGPYVLAAALKCPAFYLTCIRTGGQPPFKVTFRKFADPVVLPRKDRDAAFRRYAQTYADMLQETLADAPLQWFNFYDFWASSTPDNAPAGRDVKHSKATVVS